MLPFPDRFDSAGFDTKKKKLNLLPGNCCHDPPTSAGRQQSQLVPLVDFPEHSQWKRGGHRLQRDEQDARERVVVDGRRVLPVAGLAGVPAAHRVSGQARREQRQATRRQ